MYKNNNALSRIEQLEKERATLANKISLLKNQAKESTRRTDLRKKILIGSMFVNLMSKNENLKDQITTRLDKFLKKNIDRKIFNLPLLAKEITDEEKVN